MLDVIVLCEGQTEREFCRNVVAPSVASHDIALAGTLAGRTQRKRGGIRPWDVYRRELLRLAKERADRHLAVLVDYYAMPDCWPGRKAAPAKPVIDRGIYIENLLKDDLRGEMPGRFHPCVQLHEFESLLFVDPETTALSIAVAGGGANYSYVARKMAEIKSQSGGLVEQINDDPKTAPSKRLTQLMPGYDKAAWGVTAAADISIAKLCQGCPWLNRWLNEIVGLAA